MNNYEIYRVIMESVGKNLMPPDEKRIADYLTGRDSAPFDQAWREAYDRAEGFIHDNDETFIETEEALREAVYLQIAKLTRHYELAGYLSDDAGLIYSYRYFKQDSPFVRRLYQAYQNGRLPC